MPQSGGYNSALMRQSAVQIAPSFRAIPSLSFEQLHSFFCDLDIFPGNVHADPFSPVNIGHLAACPAVAHGVHDHIFRIAPRQDMVFSQFFREDRRMPECDPVRCAAAEAHRMLSDICPGFFLFQFDRTLPVHGIRAFAEYGFFPAVANSRRLQGVKRLWFAF